MAAKEENEQKLVLLDYWASMFCMRVKVALAEKGITDYDCRVEDLASAQKSALLLQMNPVFKKIPVLIHNGKPVCESMIIVEYIDEVWKDAKPFLSSDPYQRSQSRFWAQFVDDKLHFGVSRRSLGKNLSFKIRFYQASNKLWRTKDSTERETAKAELIESLKTLEEELGDKCYFGGDEFGYVDIALIPFYSWFGAYEACGSFNIEAECPKIIAWAKRCLQRDAVKNSLPQIHTLSEFIMGIRKQYFGIN